MGDRLIAGYQVRSGSRLDRALLLKFMDRTYRELYPNLDFSHLAQTVEQYFCPQTPLWWVDDLRETGQIKSYKASPVACLWVGSAIDQVEGDRMAHIFLLYVDPQHRRQGIGSMLMHQAETWAQKRGDRKMSLQVFTQNQPALNLYHKLGYHVQSVTMQKSF